MEARDKSTIRAIIKALHVRRIRGRLDTTVWDSTEMDALGMSYKLPHGGYDVVDKACMLLQAIVGDNPVSILDDGTQP
jgi:hypothetical protein